jgi:hypothetical protein
MIISSDHDCLSGLYNWRFVLGDIICSLIFKCDVNEVIDVYYYDKYFLCLKFLLFHRSVNEIWVFCNCHICYEYFPHEIDVTEAEYTFYMIFAMSYRQEHLGLCDSARMHILVYFIVISSTSWYICPCTYSAHSESICIYF